MYTYICTGLVFLVCVDSSFNLEISPSTSLAENEALQPKEENVSIPAPNGTLANKPIKGDQMFQVTLPFVLKPMGLIECEGANPELSGQFFEHILGSDVDYNQSDYLCGPTCRGKCVKRPQHIGIPPSFYPFGCNCQARGCGLNGPIVAPMSKPYFRMVCKADPRCTCFGMGPGQFTGYSCNWINLLSGLAVTFKEKSPIIPAGPGRPPVNLPPQFVTKFHPIKWCSCCPRTPRFPKELN